MTDLAPAIVHDGSAPPFPPRSPSPGPLERRFARGADGHAVAYVEAGSGPDLVLVHGMLMTLEDMRLGPMDALGRHFRVIAVDRPGHGASGRVRLTDASPWRQAAILRGALRAIGVDRPILVGHSFGGALALCYAMQFPDAVEAVVALAPICFPEPRLEHLLFGPRALPGAGELLAGALGATTDAGLMPLLWRAMFLPQAMPPRVAAEFPFAWARRPEGMIANGEDAAALWTSLTRSAMSYAACRVPVRILGGGADIVVNNLLHGQGAAALMPKATFELLPGLGHMLHHGAIDAVVAAARGLSPN